MLVYKDNVTHFKRILNNRRYNYSPEEIRAIRCKLGMSILVFSNLFFVDKSTVIKWEAGTRLPSGSSLRLLQFVEVMAKEKHSDINHMIRVSYSRKYGNPAI
jgi:putative transcriptional regulator